MNHITISLLGISHICMFGIHTHILCAWKWQMSRWRAWITFIWNFLKSSILLTRNDQAAGRTSSVDTECYFSWFVDIMLIWSYHKSSRMQMTYGGMVRLKDDVTPLRLKRLQQNGHMIFKSFERGWQLCAFTTTHFWKQRPVLEYLTSFKHNVTNGVFQYIYHES